MSRPDRPREGLSDCSRGQHTEDSRVDNDGGRQDSPFDSFLNPEMGHAAHRRSGRDGWTGVAMVKKQGGIRYENQGSTE